MLSVVRKGSAYKRIYNPAISRTKVWMVSGSNVTVNLLVIKRKVTNMAVPQV